MNVQAMAFGGNQLSTPQMAKPSLRSNSKKDGFSFALEQSRQKTDKQEPAVKNKSDAKISPKQSAKEEPTKEVEKEAATTNSKNEETKESSDSKQVDKRDDDVVLETEEARVIQAMADLLQITPEELEQALLGLQIEVSDLLKDNNLQKLMMEVHGVEEAMDLLSIPGVASEIKAITAVVDAYELQTILAKPEEQLLAHALEEGQIDQPEIKAAITNVNSKTNKQDENQNKLLENENKALEVKTNHGPSINAEAPKNDDLSQGEEQTSTNQNSLATEFLDNLSQSMGEVFQSQNTQVSEVGEAITSRNEVVNPRMVLDQIVEKIKVSSLNEETRMSIQLKPEHLGKVSMEIVSKQGVMTAQFKVENDKTKEMIEQNMESLRESLESQGLVIQELEVTVGQNQNEDGQAYQGPKSSKNIADLIDSIMNEEVEELEADPVTQNDTGEVNFTA